ncbi:MULTISPECIES: hypothetical protein [unclassified Nocardioides]|uniref:hypothetical protein n=1 Tax=unclassified Nocardioides TaxID=2615069 RepID=UPI0026656C2C|nr:hypothetical protein [Nocardioides sp. Arc9.136]WKN46721.1 hypothetical protein OSR43_11755 [Nocardioides sp. Arc9.136]
MSEQPDLPAEGTSPSEPVRTGVERVDQVIAAVEGLEERPLEEHVGVFETVHDELRRALDADPGPADDAAPPAGDPA